LIPTGVEAKEVPKRMRTDFGCSSIIRWKWVQNTVHWSFDWTVVEMMKADAGRGQDTVKI
jgi:hypothetical protein